jgi:hypothetical protein
VVNETNLQTADELCQTWVYYYVYQRTKMKESRENFMTRVYALRPQNRFYLIMAFSDYLTNLSRFNKKFQPPIEVTDDPAQKIYMRSLQHLKNQKEKRTVVRDLKRQILHIKDQDEEEILESFESWLIRNTKFVVRSSTFL